MQRRTDQRYQAIIDHVERIAHEHAGEQLHIGYLCQRCGVTERMLRSAFRLVHGATPYRYLRTRRMREAREALLHPKSTATVTSIATEFGFVELGRFSVEYRSAFGECPSVTLRRSSAGIASAAASHARVARPFVIEREGQDLSWSGGSVQTISHEARRGA